MNGRAQNFNLNSIQGALFTYGALILAGILGYAGALKTPFLYDDAHAIVENPNTWDPSGLIQGGWLNDLFYRPFLTLTFAANRALGGLNVLGYHLVNLWLHIAVGLVFYVLVRQWLRLVPEPGRRELRSLPLLAALIQLVHPLNSQAVIYLSSRSSLLATLLFLLALLCWSPCLREGTRALTRPEGLAGFVLGLLFFFLGAGTKAIIVSFPIVALIYHGLAMRAEGRRMDSTLATLLLAPLFLYLAYRSMTLGPLLHLPGDSDSTAVSRPLYLLTQVKAFFFYYLFKWLIPVNLNFEPDFRLVAGAGDGSVAASLLLMALLTGLWLRSRSGLVKFALLWTVVTLAPTSSLIPLKQVVTEHRFYLPGLGMQVILALFWLQAVRGRPQARALIAAALACLLLLTVVRGRDYRSEIRLWQDTAAKSPRKALVHNNLATAYLGEKRYEEAERSLNTSLELDPNSGHAQINLGFILLQAGRYEDALPKFYRAIELGTGDPAAFYNAGMALVRLKRDRESIPFLEEAARLKPASAQYHYDLARALQQDRRFDEALAEYRISLKIQPDNPKAYNNMGTIFWELKSYYFAEGAFAQAYQQDPGLVEVLNNLVSANMVLRQYDDAIAYLQRLLELKPDDENARQLLVAARRLKETLGSARPVH